MLYCATNQTSQPPGPAHPERSGVASRGTVPRPTAAAISPAPQAGEATGAGRAVLTAPAGQPDRLHVSETGAPSTEPAAGLPPYDPGAPLAPPNGLRYRLAVADGGQPGTVPASGAADSNAPAFTLAAGPTSATRQQAGQALVQPLKVPNLWPRLRAVYPMVGATKDAHSPHRQDPRHADTAFCLTCQHSPGHSVRGVGQAATTHPVPAGHLGPAKLHVAYYAATDRAPTAASEEVELPGEPSRLGRYADEDHVTYFDGCAPTQITAGALPWAAAPARPPSSPTAPGNTWLYQRQRGPLHPPPAARQPGRRLPPPKVGGFASVGAGPTPTQTVAGGRTGLSTGAGPQRDAAARRLLLAQRPAAVPTSPLTLTPLSHGYYYTADQQ